MYTVGHWKAYSLTERLTEGMSIHLKMWKVNYNFNKTHYFSNSESGETVKCSWALWLDYMEHGPHTHTRQTERLLMKPVGFITPALPCTRVLDFLTILQSPPQSKRQEGKGQNCGLLRVSCAPSPPPAFLLLQLNTSPSFYLSIIFFLGCVP